VALLQAVEDIGFEGTATGRGDAACLQLDVGGMTCSTCASAVEAALLALPGVLEASANAVTGRAEARYDPDAVGARALPGVRAGHWASPNGPLTGSRSASSR
jgi:copper chaperone CopZ